MSEEMDSITYISFLERQNAPNPQMVSHETVSLQTPTHPESEPQYQEERIKPSVIFPSSAQADHTRLS